MSSVGGAVEEGEKIPSRHRRSHKSLTQKRPVQNALPKFSLERRCHPSTRITHPQTHINMLYTQSPVTKKPPNSPQLTALCPACLP